MSLVAIAMLLLITNWFFHKVYWSGWIARFHGHKRTLLAGVAGQAIGFALLGFVSVYREGFETALFLQALFLRAGADTVLAGVLLGGAAVAAVGVLTLHLEKKLPHKKMLVVAGVLIGTVLITLVGSTVHVMQAVLWVPGDADRGPGNALLAGELVRDLPHLADLHRPVGRGCLRAGLLLHGPAEGARQRLPFGPGRRRVPAAARAGGRGLIALYVNNGTEYRRSRWISARTVSSRRWPRGR